MIRTVFLAHSAIAVVAIAVGMGTSLSAAENEKIPPKELVRYIQERKEQGATEARIKQQAILIGWEPAAVAEAIAYVESRKAQESCAGVSAGSGSAGRGEEATETAGPASQGMSDKYQIGSGDTLQVSVWKEPDVSVPSVVVRPDGRITVPLIKEIEVGGLTPREAEKTITARLSKFITDPNVTVVVAAMNSKKIYVIGGARKEGPLPYTYGMTVMQALSEAGGLGDYAKRKKIYILRTENSREYRLDFNYDEVVKGQRMDQNILLLPGDTVVIPR